MFIKAGGQVSVDGLLQGVLVQSGNDASVALAEAVAGSEDAFAALMNQEAAKQGLHATHFVNSTGLPDPTHLTSVRDLAILSRNLVVRFPQYPHRSEERRVGQELVRTVRFRGSPCHLKKKNRHRK